MTPIPAPTPEEADSKYDALGGDVFFEELVAGFYARVAVDESLRPMYPDADLGPAARRLELFLKQYWGGPKTYSEERGHPRLRMRHAPFVVDVRARDRWLLLMGQSLNEVCSAQELDEGLKDELWTYLERTAHAIMNQPEPITLGEKPTAGA